LIRIGEIRTGLIQNSNMISLDSSIQLLSSLAGVRPTVSQRPIRQVRSAPKFEGVDCFAPSAKGRKAGLVGTVECSASLTGNRIIQTSSTTTITRKVGKHRREQWSYYLANPGMSELGSQFETEELIESFLRTTPQPSVLDLGAIAERRMNEIQSNTTILDRRPPIRSSRSIVRWAHFDETVEAAESRFDIHFRIESDLMRTLYVHTMNAPTVMVDRFCECIAYHDWLLTSVGRRVESIGHWAGQPHDLLPEVSPIIEHLLNLWMPMAHVPLGWSESWRALEESVGFSREWASYVETIRNFVTISTLRQLEILREEIGKGPYEASP